MLTSPPATLVIRDAIPRDEFAVTRVLAAALRDGAIGRWLGPDADNQPLTLMRYVGGLVTRVIDSGIVRLVEDRGEVVAAALWSLDPLIALPPVPGGAGGGPFRERLSLLREVTQTRRPWRQAHQELLLLGVRPDRQRQGLAGYLLIGHHAFLHVTGICAFAVALDGPWKQLLERHGYTAMGPAQLLPGAVPLWAMLRPPGVADR